MGEGIKMGGGGTMLSGNKFEITALENIERGTPVSIGFNIHSYGSHDLDESTSKISGYSVALPDDVIVSTTSNPPTAMATKVNSDGSVTLGIETLLGDFSGKYIMRMARFNDKQVLFVIGGNYDSYIHLVLITVNNDLSITVDKTYRLSDIFDVYSLIRISDGNVAMLSSRSGNNVFSVISIDEDSNFNISDTALISTLKIVSNCFMEKRIAIAGNDGSNGKCVILEVEGYTVTVGALNSTSYTFPSKLFLEGEILNFFSATYSFYQTAIQNDLTIANVNHSFLAGVPLLPRSPIEQITQSFRLLFSTYLARKPSADTFTTLDGNCFTDVSIKNVLADTPSDSVRVIQLLDGRLFIKNDVKYVVLDVFAASKAGSRPIGVALNSAKKGSKIKVKSFETGGF